MPGVLEDNVMKNALFSCIQQDEKIGGRLIVKRSWNNAQLQDGSIMHEIRESGSSWLASGLHILRYPKSHQQSSLF